MKVKGLVDKIYRINSNSVNFSMRKLDDLKEGKEVELSKEDADDLLKRGFAEAIKTSKKGDK